MQANDKTRKLSRFLPEDIKQKILETLQKHYPGEKELATALGIDSFLVKAWQKSKSVAESGFPEILALALQECPETKQIIQEQVLLETTNLCTELGIIGDDKQGDIKKFLEELDEESKRIFLHVLRNGHAKISELTAIAFLPTDSITLNHIQGLINPKGEKFFGGPVMVFKEAGFAGGKKVLFSWWVDESLQPMPEKNSELFVISDEKDFLRITLEMPNVKKEDIAIDVCNELVFIHSKNGDERTNKKIPIYCKANKKILEKTFNNGMLEIKLKKE